MDMFLLQMRPEPGRVVSNFIMGVKRLLRQGLSNSLVF